MTTTGSSCRTLWRMHAATDTTTPAMGLRQILSSGRISVAGGGRSTEAGTSKYVSISGDSGRISTSTS
jgi:hypothetical protein